LADHWDNTGPRVSDIVPYSPAAEAKVFSKGDKVVTVDGFDVRGKRVEAIKELILGPPGSAIEIGSLRTIECVLFL
jgi:C-terminal processing protease CtpA/Prc